jgi:endonuclease/exonuclease/phosphatase family metal-dependent hydrolase
MKNWIRITGIKSATCASINNTAYKKTFKILTYNCYLRSCGVVSSCLFDYKNERLDEIIENVLPDYDIICLQEVFASLSFRMNHLIDRPRELGFKYYVVPTAPAFLSRKLIDSGLVILSKHPILEYQCISFNHPGIFSDQLADKGFQYAKILVHGRIIHVINTHVQSDYEIYDDLSHGVKIKQLEQIKNFTDKIHEKSLYDIYLCGDLNCNSIHIYKFKPTILESKLYTDMKWLFTLHHNTDNKGNSDLLFDKTHPKDKYGHHPGQRPATSYSTYNLQGMEIDTINRTQDYVYLASNGYVCLPRSVDYIILLRNNQQTKQNVKCIKCKTKNFESINVNKKNRRIKYLSDHLAVYAKMKFINNYIK